MVDINKKIGYLIIVLSNIPVYMLAACMRKGFLVCFFLHLPRAGEVNEKIDRKAFFYLRTVGSTITGQKVGTFIAGSRDFKFDFGLTKIL